MVYVYLNEEITVAEGFKMIEKSGGKPLQRWKVPEFKGIEMSRDRGRLCFSLHYANDMVPEILQPFVAGVSFHECFALRPARETGVYKGESFGDASADLDVNSSNYFLRISGSKIEEIAALYKAIRTGAIRPTESYEGHQQGMSRKELGQELEATQRTLAGAQGRLDQLQIDLVRLRNPLVKNSWSVCRKITVGRKVNKILYN